MKVASAPTPRKLLLKCVGGLSMSKRVVDLFAEDVSARLFGAKRPAGGPELGLRVAAEGLFEPAPCLSVTR